MKSKTIKPVWNSIAKLFAKHIVLGRRDIESVPEKYKSEVLEIIESGYYDFSTE